MKLHEMPDDERAQALQSLRATTARLMLDLRAEFLAGGASAISHWDQLHSRFRASAMTTSSVQEFVTDVARRLRLESPSKDRCSTIDALSGLVAELDCRDEWLTLVEIEIDYIAALARLEAERRKEEREAKKLTGGRIL